MWLQRFDTNGDGNVSRDELISHLPEQWPAELKEKYWNFFCEYDKNRDGNLQVEEIEAYLFDLYSQNQDLII